MHQYQLVRQMKNNTSQALQKMKSARSQSSFENQVPNRQRPQYKQPDIYGKPNVLINDQGIAGGEYINKGLSKFSI